MAAITTAAAITRISPVCPPLSGVTVGVVAGPSDVVSVGAVVSTGTVVSAVSGGSAVVYGGSDSSLTHFA